MNKEALNKANIILWALVPFIIFSWFRWDNNRFDWLMQFEVWAIRMLAFPIFVLVFFRKSKAFVYYAILTLLTFVSNVSDMGFIDEYDKFFLSIKVALTAMIVWYLIKQWIEERKENDKIFN